MSLTSSDRRKKHVGAVTDRLPPPPQRGTDVPILGTTLFSLTPDWRAGAAVLDLLGRLAAARRGPALEGIGHPARPGLPRPTPGHERALRHAAGPPPAAPPAL